MIGQVALITGSTSGIGLAIAKTLASRGIHVAINGFGRDEDIAAICREITEECGVECIYLPADLTSPQEAHGMVTKCIAHFGQLDILVNNAGIQHVSPIDTFPPEKWEMIIRLNLIAAFYTIAAALPGMKSRSYGRIINIASAHGLVASPFKSAYVAAKHGIVGLTKSVALEVARQGITVNAICPGYVNTFVVQNQLDDICKTRGITREHAMENVILGAQATKRFVEVHEIAAYVEFLCGPASSSITGAAMTIDGGWTAA